MKPTIEFANTDIFGHKVDTKTLPDLDFSLAGFEAILDHCKAHVPRNPAPYEAIPSEGLSVRIIR